MLIGMAHIGSACRPNGRRGLSVAPRSLGRLAVVGREAVLLIMRVSRCVSSRQRGRRTRRRGPAPQPPDVPPGHGDSRAGPEVIITIPVIEGTNGPDSKMSKSQGNYIGLSSSPDEIFGRLIHLRSPHRVDRRGDRHGRRACGQRHRAPHGRQAHPRRRGHRHPPRSEGRQGRTCRVHRPLLQPDLRRHPKPTDRLPQGACQRSPGHPASPRSWTSHRATPPAAASPPRTASTS